MPGYIIWPKALRIHNPISSNRDCQNGRLCILGLLEVFQGTVKAKLAQRKTQGLIGFFKRLAGYRKLIVQFPSHAWILGGLTRKDEAHFAQLIKILWGGLCCIR